MALLGGVTELDPYIRELIGFMGVLGVLNAWLLIYIRFK